MNILILVFAMFVGLWNFGVSAKLFADISSNTWNGMSYALGLPLALCILLAGDVLILGVFLLLRRFVIHVS